MSAIAEIGGHPFVLAHRDDIGLPPIRITICAGCERVRRILFLSKDRWMCTGCREEGDARRTMIPVRRPGR